MSDTPYHAIRELLRTDPAAALLICETLLERAPADAEAHRFAARSLRALGQEARAAREELAAIDAAAHDPLLQRAAVALLDNRLDVAEPILRTRLRENPFDVAAIRMLAEIAGRIGRNADAEALLRRALDLAPAFVAARTNLATALHRQNKTAEALAELDKLNADDPGNPAHTNLRAAVLGRIGEFDEAIQLYEEVLAKGGRQSGVWMSYGHALKTVGRQADGIAAYRQAVELRPAFGEAWWSIANLKTVRFDRADITAMSSGLSSPDASVDDCLHLHFALGKAHEDIGEPLAAFDHYAQGNRLRRTVLPYDADQTTRLVDHAIAQFTPAFFAEREGWGCPAPDPIFVIGLPRAGSTLIEQILSSHSQVEGTMELPDLPALAAQIGHEDPAPGAIERLTRKHVRELGEAYIERTLVQRREDRPLFIDKLPNNWLNIGLIRLILPNAKIIDARRHPLDCCYSNFRQHFARGQAFTYDLAAIGRYYADYVRLMSHFDMQQPGMVHRVVHERVLDDPEAETRALLAALGLPFEEACLRFHENARAVRTASSEQVRRPINRDGEGLWRPVADRLEPLRQALGEALERHDLIQSAWSAGDAYKKDGEENLEGRTI